MQKENYNKILRESLNMIVAKMLDSEISKFEHKSQYYCYFRINKLDKNRKKSLIPLAMGQII